LIFHFLFNLGSVDTASTRSVTSLKGRELKRKNSKHGIISKNIEITVDVKKLAKEKWKVRRGYSSGASSHGTDDDHTNDPDKGMTTEPPPLDLSKIPRPQKPLHHRDVSEGSCLNELREVLGKDGDLAKTVVRIEVWYSSALYMMFSLFSSCIENDIPNLFQPALNYPFQCNFFIVFT
jgi:hypothetical protein